MRVFFGDWVQGWRLYGVWVGKWFVGVSRSDLSKFVETCRQIIAARGRCRAIYCQHCPGYSEYNGGIICSDNGWASKDGSDAPNEMCVRSAKEWLRTHGYSDADMGGEAPL